MSLGIAEIVMLLVLFVGPAVVVGVIAKGRGARSWPIWPVIAFLLGPFGLLLILALPKPAAGVRG